jgi:hypothetical protein
MSLRRFSLISLIAISLGATSALADNVAAPHEVKPKASKAKGARPAPPTSDLGNIKFSDPSAPVVGEAKTKPAVPSDAKGVAAQPNVGGMQPMTAPTPSTGSLTPRAPMVRATLSWVA